MSSASFSGHQDVKPRVSIIIPTFNRSAIVPNAIESVFRETYSDYELIVVDDGSTDDTRDRLQEYVARIKYVYQANRGVSAARNAGTKLARGEWIAFLDSDDVWHPTKLERQFEALALLGSGSVHALPTAIISGDPVAQSLTSLKKTRLGNRSPLVHLDNPRPIYRTPKHM